MAAIYGNRCAARLRLGELDKAFDDSLSASICSPVDKVKPFLRCAETLAALVLLEEMNNLLQAASLTYPASAEAFAMTHVSGRAGKSI